MRISSLEFYLPFLFFFPFSICSRSKGRQLGLSPPPSPWWHPVSMCSLPPSACCALSGECDHSGSGQEYRAGRTPVNPLGNQREPLSTKSPPPHPTDCLSLTSSETERKPCRFQGGHLAPEIIAGILPSLTLTSSPSPAHSACVFS